MFSVSQHASRHETCCSVSPKPIIIADLKRVDFHKVAYCLLEEVFQADACSNHYRENHDANSAVWSQLSIVVQGYSIEQLSYYFVVIRIIVVNMLSNI